jgi:hypothetical protein
MVGLDQEVVALAEDHRADRTDLGTSGLQSSGRRWRHSSHFTIFGLNFAHSDAGDVERTNDLAEATADAAARLPLDDARIFPSPMR